MLVDNRIISEKPNRFLAQVESAQAAIKRQPRWLIVTISMVLLAIVSYCDWVTGPQIRLAILYLIPLSIAALLVGRVAGFVMGLLISVVSLVLLLVSGASYISPSAEITNAASRMIFYVLLVHSLTDWQRVRARLERTVRERTSALSEEINERKRAESALHLLTMQLADAEDAERRRLAHDIHDSVGQSLSLLKFRLESVAKSEQVGDLKQATSDSLNMVNSLIAQSRSLLFELHPPMLDDLGLVPALRWYAKSFQQQTGTQMTISENGEPLKLPSALASYFFRSIKELVNNARKHGQATEVVVTVSWRKNEIRAIVDDNGKGFNSNSADSPPQVGLGLAAIRERAATLNGEFQIESQLNQGTRAMLTVPITM